MVELNAVLLLLLLLLLLLVVVVVVLLLSGPAAQRSQKLNCCKCSGHRPSAPNAAQLSGRI